MRLQINGRTVELTERESEALKLMADGLSRKEMADQMGIEIKTVEKHRQQVFNKTGIHDVVRLTHFALSRGVIVNAYAGEPNG